MRFVRAQEWNTQRPHVEAIRCPTCTEGNQVNTDREARAIAHYIQRRQFVRREASAGG